MSIEDLDDRRSWSHGALVYSDRYGPREFWRAGQQVGCICDEDRGVLCAYHGQMRESREGRESAERTRGGP